MLTIFFYNIEKKKLNLSFFIISHLYAELNCLIINCYIYLAITIIHYFCLNIL